MSTEKKRILEKGAKKKKTEMRESTTPSLFLCTAYFSCSSQLPDVSQSLLTLRLVRTSTLLSKLVSKEYSMTENKYSELQEPIPNQTERPRESSRRKENPVFLQPHGGTKLFSQMLTARSPRRRAACGKRRAVSGKASRRGVCAHR